MSNYINLKRLNSILSFLKLNTFPSIVELLDKININNDKSISERTLKRDLDDLEGLGLKISYSKAKNGYFINQDKSSNHLSSLLYLLEAQDKIGILLENKDLLSQNNKKVRFEDDLYQFNSEFLKQILHHLHHNSAISIGYKKFENKENKIFEVFPQVIKQHQNRFYVITTRIEDGRIITLALDRITEIKTFETTSKLKKLKFDYDTYFKNTFGITHIEEPPQKIILRVFDTEIDYIKTLPLHDSQKIVSENEKFIDIEIKIVPNYEFENKILSIGEKIKVLEPLSFKNLIINRLKLNLENYKL
ncbi:MAG: WYL domain-containing protein [Cytophagales bacterium]|nr:MAG: WYL domain-containing protein [Cytophagales bacterium]